MTPEQVVLVDEKDRVTGIAEKLDAHQRGLLHRAFSVIVWDRRGRQLLQRRAVAKYHSGGLWTNACCGHPRPQEDNLAAASRRLREEMGFSCPLTELGTVYYLAKFDNGLTEHEIVHVFRGTFEGTISPDPDEAEDHVWRSLDDIRRDLSCAPERYSIWFRQYIAAEWPMALAAPVGMDQSQG
jgi:isopentenyl-diphosphate delta-isomerase